MQTQGLTNADIDTAFARGEFCCVYQPKLDLTTGAILGAEALVRWHHERLGELPPGVFLSYLRRQGRLQELTQFVFSQALQAVARWRQSGEPWPVHINLCADDLCFPGLYQFFEIRLRRHSLPAEAVRLELPEADVAALGRQARGRLARLLSTGFSLALQGPSEVPCRENDEIPVAEFQLRGCALLGLAEALSDTRSGRVLGLIRAAKRLQRQTTAIGLETMVDVETARALGFDAATGFALARPMALDDLLEWVALRHAKQPRSSGAQVAQDQAQDQIPDAQAARRLN